LPVDGLPRQGCPGPVAQKRKPGLVWRNVHNKRLVRVGEPLLLFPPNPTLMPSAATLVQLLISGGILAGLIVVGWLVVQRFRGGAADVGRSEREMLTKFQEMRHEGDISEAEYRTIKSVLGEELQRNVKDGKNKG
jgi:hypothetical protein